MKKAGLIIPAFGLVITLVTGFNYVTKEKEKAVEIGDLEVIAGKTNRGSWSSIIGIAVMIVGGIILIAGEERR